MTPPDLAQVHSVILAWLRRVLASLPEPARDSAAETVEIAEAVTLERWRVAQDRWGLLRLEGVLVAHDGYEFRFRVTPVAVDLGRHLVWTSHRWMRLGSHAEMAEGEPLAALLAELENWCAALREGLRHG